MSQQIISTGTVPNDGTGDNLRTGASKINANFTELYSKTLPSLASNAGKFLTTDGNITSWSTVGNITGNAATVTNGVYSNNSYNDPSWIASLSPAKVLPSQSTNGGKFLTTDGTTVSWATVSAVNAVLTTSTYNDPSWLTGLAGSKISGTVSSATNATTVTNGVYTSGSYSDPSWITSLSPTKVLPSQSTNAGKYLKTDGSVLSWSTVVGLVTRSTASVTTGALAPGASANVTITGFKGYALLGIQVSLGAWVTVYTSANARSADSTRSISTDPTPGSGVIAESITSSSGTTYFTPAVIGFSNESSPDTNIPIKVYNNSGSTTSTITVTLTLIQLEA
jgi:hypothetical protein